MSRKPKASQTMRIDIHPDDDVSSPVTVYESEDTSFIKLPGRKSGHDTDFNRLLQSIYDGVLIADLKGYISDYNAQAASIFGWEGNGLVGTNVVDRIQGANRDLLETIRQNLSDRRHTIIDATCIRADGSDFPAEIAVNSMEIDNLPQMCFFIRDITARKQVLEALKDAVTRLEEHDRAKSQFVSNVSHELRTPLTSMLYAVANLLKGVAGPLPEKVEKYLEMMNGDCKRLLGTVNDILDLRKIDSDSLTLAKTKLPFADFIRNATNSLKVQADQKLIKLYVTEPDDSSKWFVECDPLKIERVILNLIGNSIKFTPTTMPDGGEIEVILEEDTEHDGYVRCSVRDNGIGIPENMIEHVTKRYFTVGDQVIGSGLGLSLSKEIIEKHGGGIGIASPPPGFDKGTIVSIILPLVDPPRILVVDDEEMIRNLTGKQMVEHGYEVVKADGGEEALKALAEGDIDVVVLDLIMPDMGGTEVIMRMKSDKKLMGIPIIVITGGNVDAAKAEVLNNFSIPAMTKPWKKEELLDTVGESLLARAAVKGRII